MANITGTSKADSLTGTSNADRILALAGNDTLSGADGADTLFGGLGNDVIVAGRGNDAIDGGSGNDLVLAAGTLDQYAFNLSSGALRMTDEIAGRDGRDRLKHVEAVLFSDGYRLSLTGANNNPYAVADTAGTTEGNSVLIDVLANDFDPDQTIFDKATTLSISEVREPVGGGTVTISDGKVLYDPGTAFDFLDAGEIASDKFSYRVTDGNGGFRTGTVTVTITGTETTPSIDLSSLDGKTGFRLDGVAIDDESGRSVASAGDVNGDGFDDLIIGAPRADTGGNYSGASYVVFGKAESFAATLDLSTLNGVTGFRLDGATTYDQSGRSVASAGDVNGDGLDDLIVGAPYSGSAGASFVIFGKVENFDPSLDLSTLDGKTGFRLNGIESSDASGASVASAGDVNGDGFDDLIIGAPTADPGGNYSGASFVVFGKAGGFASVFDLATLDGTNGFRLNGEATYDQAGHAVASAGDMNGDGFDDLIVGAPTADTIDESSGASYVIFGQASGFSSTLDLSTLNGETGFRLDGPGAFDVSGVSVASAGDVNGDGFDDVIVGANGTDPGGASYVVFGKAGGFASTLDLSTLDGKTGFRLDGATGDSSGFSVASAGDFNGDGFVDLIIGAISANPGGTDSGASYLVFGKAAGFASTFDLTALDDTTGLRLDGVASFDYSGYSVASAGDVNGDGFDDLIIGALFADPGGSESGASYVVFGGNFGTSSSQLSIADVLDVSGPAGDTAIGESSALTQMSDDSNGMPRLTLQRDGSDLATLVAELQSGP